MHAVLHLKQGILQYGPVHAHWTFPWERMNGCMGSIPMNRHHVEQQFMRSFVRRMVLRELPSMTGTRLAEKEAKLFSSMWGEVKSASRGLTGQQLVDALVDQYADEKTQVTGCKPVDAELKKPVEAEFDEGDKDDVEEFVWLHESMKKHWNTQRLVCDRKHLTCPRLRLYGDMLGSDTGRWKSSSYVLVTVDGRALPAQCIRFVQCNMIVYSTRMGPPERVTCLLARLRFFPRVNDLGKEMQDTMHTWQMDDAKFTLRAPHPVRYWPVARIRSRFVLAPLPESVVKVRGMRAEPPCHFKTCPLPLQLPF